MGSKTVTTVSLEFLWTIIYLTIVGIVLSTIYAIIEWFSRDRVIKIFSGERAFVLIGSDAYYGEIHVPPRSGGGFEVLFPPEGIENPETLIAFLLENYRETGDEKFLEEARVLIEDLKEKGILSREITLDSITINPWAPPSLVSRKIDSSEVNNIHMICIFKHLLTEEERRKRWEDLKKLYHPLFFNKVKRKIYNSLVYVKDKIAGTVTKTTYTFMSPLPAELRRGIEDMEKKAIAVVGSVYDSLLENSIGRLITIQVQDVDGETKLYQGVLREYSNKYIAVYDVDYRVQMVARYTGENILKGYPKPMFRLHGKMFKEPQHLAVKELSYNSENKIVSFKLKNIRNEPVKVESIQVNSNKVIVNKVLGPHEDTSIKIASESPSPKIEILYEICKEADVIWPRAKVKVVGLGDYPPTLLRSILSRKVFR
ncbi:MAG: hypothetical protein DRJ49_05945 [Thermoprotei archaeon]|nr:MAG: hypothetical protein DRN53_03240 [Thermoprotei archaeon]RLE87790.1 MAG: hypothetical protein DRJ49_05945 [Thermoprotei archaeon]